MLCNIALFIESTQPIGNEEAQNPTFSDKAFHSLYIPMRSLRFSAYSNRNISLLVILLARWKFVGEIEQYVCIPCGTRGKFTNRFRESKKLCDIIFPKH